VEFPNITVLLTTRCRPSSRICLHLWLAYQDLWLLFG